jgi:hypothetical protein
LKKEPIIDKNAKIPSDCQIEITPRPKIAGINQFHNHMKGYATIATIRAMIPAPARMSNNACFMFLILVNVTNFRVEKNYA